MNQSNWIFVTLFLFCGFINITVEARDYCREHRLATNGIGYCLNGGTCVNAYDGKQCDCLPGFKGETCTDQVDLCSINPGICLNGATCGSKWGQYECYCMHGFEGKHCEIDIDNCVDNQCPSTKVCVDGVDRYFCECPAGKFGPDCEHDDLCYLKNPCKYGNCSMSLDGNYFCECESGITGKNCDIDINECSYNPCVNGGCENTFGDYRCHCDAGFMGKNCDDLIMHCAGNPCQNGGSCINNYGGHTCICMPGFNGSNCEERLDKSCNLECQNGGVCYMGRECSCPSAFKGKLCDKNKKDPCNHNLCGEHGFCLPTPDYTEYYCQCFEGYRGDHCQMEECITGECKMAVDYCQADHVTCSNRGKCINLADKYHCKCESDDYIGKDCEYSVNGADNDSTTLRGDLIVVFIGPKESVIGRLHDILQRLGTLLRVSVRVHLNDDSRPIIYEWDSTNGVGELVDTTQYIDVNDKSLVFGKPTEKRESTKSKALAQKKKSNPEASSTGFMVYLRIDITPCLEEQKRANSTLDCPKDIIQLASILLTSSTHEFLDPLGVSIHSVEGKEADKRIDYTYYVIGAFVVFGLIVLIGVLTIQKKRLAYRDRNLITASTWIPPKIDINKSFTASMASLDPNNPHQYGMNCLPNNASTITSIGTTSTNGSLHSAPKEQLSRNYHDSMSLSELHIALKTIGDQHLYREVQKLLASNPDLVNAVDSMGRTPLMYAVSRRGDLGLQMIDLLVNYGADLTHTDRDGLSVLHMAIESIDSFNERAALHLIQNFTNLDLNAAARSEETPLKLCARVGDLTEMVVRALLMQHSDRVDIDNIGDSDFPDSLRRTALHIASEAGSVKIMELLLKNGANKDIKDINDQTALHLASENMRSDALEILLNYNADRSIVDADNRTPEQVAKSAFWNEGIRIFNEPPNQTIEKKPADTASKNTKRAKRANNATTKAAAKKPRNKINAASEALLPTPSSLLSPPSDSSSPPTNGLPSLNHLNGLNKHIYNYPASSVQNYHQNDLTHYQQQMSNLYYHQQTPEIMNSSVCSSDSQTLSPPIASSSNNQIPNNLIAIPAGYHNYNMGPNFYQNHQQQSHYNTAAMYPQMRVGDASAAIPGWYHDQNGFYVQSSKIPSYSSGTNSLEYSPNSDQTVHNFGSPDTQHPAQLQSTTANGQMQYTPYYSSNECTI